MTYAFARIGAVVAMKVEDYYPVTTTPDGQAFFASLAGNYRAQRPSRAGPSRHRPRRRELPADRSHRVQQVEDQLAGLRILAQQAEVQDKAVAAAFEAARIINHQYLAGTVAYTSVSRRSDRVGQRRDCGQHWTEPPRRERRPDPSIGRRLGHDTAAKPRTHRRKTPRSTLAHFRQRRRCGRGERCLSLETAPA
jgi:hypothetical protein